MPEEAGVAPIRIVELLPELLGVKVKVDANRALLPRGRGPLEVGAGIIDHLDPRLITRTEELLLFPLPLVRAAHVRRVGADGDLQRAGVTRLRHLEQLLGKLVGTFIILSQLKIHVKPENIDHKKIKVTFKKKNQLTFSDNLYKKLCKFCGSSNNQVAKIFV